jgi:hypothetical protein
MSPNTNTNVNWDPTHLRLDQDGIRRFCKGAALRLRHDPRVRSSQMFIGVGNLVTCDAFL